MPRAKPRTGTSIPSPPPPLGAGTSELPVSEHAQGLSSNTPYHYRLVAVSELAPGVFEEFDGADHAFTTQTWRERSLLDGRAWELVSPADKHAGQIWA